MLVIRDMATLATEGVTLKSSLHTHQGVIAR